MRAILVAALAASALVLAGCGQADESPSAEPSESTRKTVDTAPSVPAEQGPPDVLLVSETGGQVGKPGSWCVENLAAGYATCADGVQPSAEHANVVRPDETIAIALDGARAVKSDGCHARDQSCIGEANVSPAGCTSATVARIFLKRGPQTEWRVDLPPGAYELQVFVYFEADDGRTGDVSVALGLLVDGDAEQRIVPMPAAAAICP